jgi:hypothetical protein
MISLSPKRPDAARRPERLSNWLALLALLAGSVVWGSGDGAAPGGAHAYQPASVLPGGHGERVIAGHRDSTLRFLRH